MTMTILALLGSKALYLLFAWLGSAIVCSWLSERKGYGEKPGLATGLLTTVLGVVVWLVWPPRPESRWKTEGPLPKRNKAPDGPQQNPPPPPAAQAPSA